MIYIIQKYMQIHYYIYIYIYKYHFNIFSKFPINKYMSK